MRDKTLETLILNCLKDYGMDEPEDVLAAEVYNRRCNVTTQRLNESINYLVECECVARNETVCHDVTYAITKIGLAALKGC